tara:strand:+ start:164 stop:418 length:255 start_codon:yes stop_codon:yes gene_type:complete
MVTRIDDHVFINFPKQIEHFWSPQLHLEINKKDEQSATAHCLFGPNTSVWAMFMLFRFMAISLFIVFSIWAHANTTIVKSYALR